MPKFTDDTDLEQHKIGNFGFSATPLDKLKGEGYTLATLLFDISGSTQGFQDPMEQALKNAILALREHPTSDSILVRVMVFGSKSHEIHGFKKLNEINPDDYVGILTATGMTALFDANIDAAEAALNYAKILRDDGYTVNGIHICCTDGGNNSGKFSAQFGDHEYKKHIKAVHDAFHETITRKELLESYISLLITVGVGPNDQILSAFHAEAGFTHPMIPLDSDPKTIGKIGGFIHDSVSSQSAAKGTGGPSMSVKW